jgi:hypothetical protein
MRPISRSQFTAGAVLACIFVATPQARAQQLPLEPRHDAGASITGVFEGWFRNPNGSFSLLFGYYNRNLKEEVDVAVGPNNRIEPGGPDQGQPTHFLPGRMWGSFTINVPKDFDTAKLTWTIVANGRTNVIPASLKPDWELSPFVDANTNTPPFLSFESFDQNGAMVQGPRGLIVSREIVQNQPLKLTVWTADDNTLAPGVRIPKNPVSITWSVFRGPGVVTFSEPKPAVVKTEGKMPPKTTYAGTATTTATFSIPGEYMLQVVANDATGDGGGGFQCCWTTAQVKVLVKPTATGAD